jgi:hypothetical protein
MRTLAEHAMKVQRPAFASGKQDNDKWVRSRKDGKVASG